MNANAPELSFACELDPQPLVELFANPDVIAFLRESGSAVTLAILDLSSHRAEVVHQLNEAGIPVTAWLLLPKDQGYWMNLDNAALAMTRYEMFIQWTREHGLQWERIGLDIEPDIRMVQHFSRRSFAHLGRIINHLFDTVRLVRGRKAYQALIDRIHGDGYLVETYHFPFIVDERMAHSTMLQRLTGIVDLPDSDRELLMLYSSFSRPWGQGLLWSYAPYARGIGVGSTGGGVALEGVLATRPLNWAELETDLLLAHRHSDNIMVFSLEGCVQQDFLPQIQAMDWQADVNLPLTYAARVDSYRGLLGRVLWLSGRPAWLLFALALLVSLVTWIRRRTR